ncbi:MAG: hypothetical protein AUI14_10480 [Actinobacteria bacterium 13_2_20CM_2_71_6]|nr:MAG: hypothetical protein AUI14_10480 [Actinobacteria bacterium 13_2_20CM_2_71_6]
MTVFSALVAAAAAALVPATAAHGSVNGQLQDMTPGDGRCAVLWLYGEDQGQILDLSACDGNMAFFQTGSFRGTFTVGLISFVQPNGPFDQMYFVDVPSSVDEPGMRSRGTGAWFKYTRPDSVQFGLRSFGVTVDGVATHEANQELRSASATVQRTAGVECVTGSMADAPRARWAATNCVVSQTFGTDHLRGDIDYTGCGEYHAFELEVECLSSSIPMPFN